MTSRHSTCERWQIQRTSGLWYSAEYSTFSISDEAGNYRLTVAGYSGDAGDAMTAPASVNHRATGKMFSTPDQDHDTFGGSCAVQRGAGWWYGYCTLNDINRDSGVNGVWRATAPYVSDVKASRMMLKMVWIQDTLNWVSRSLTGCVVVCFYVALHLQCGLMFILHRSFRWTNPL